MVLSRVENLVSSVVGNVLALVAAILVAMGTSLVMERLDDGRTNLWLAPTPEQTAPRRVSVSFFRQPLLALLAAFTLVVLVMTILAAARMAGFGRGGAPAGQILLAFVLLGPIITALVAITRQRPEVMEVLAAAEPSD